MKISVLDAKALGDDLDFSVLSEFGEVKVYDNSEDNEIVQRLKDVDIAVINKLKINEKTLGDNTKLKLICEFATGYDNIDTRFCRENGIAVCNVVGYSTMSVTQLTVSTVLSLVTHLPQFAECVSSGKYSNGNVANCLTPVFHEIDGMTWGIAGYGNIGSAVGRVAEALGCKVIAFKQTEMSGVKKVDIDTLCRESDIISVHLPLNDGTRNIINRERIAMMKKTAVFVNAARGAVTDESALADAIKENKLGGLGADVYSFEPLPKDHPFYEIKNYENVCFTPHMAWGAKEARDRCLNEICKNIRAFLNGEKRCRVD